jgi:hypothetical protein
MTEDEDIVGYPPEPKEPSWDEPEMLARVAWDEFRDAGLMWWVNRQLHLFGWSLVAVVDPADPAKTVKVYPARTEFRGFCSSAEERGFKSLTRHLHESVDELRDTTDKLTPPEL